VSANGARGTAVERHVPFQANATLRLAQLAALTQAAVAVIAGANLVGGSTMLTDIHTGVNLTQDSALDTRYGIGILVIAALIIALTVVVAHPSKIARALLVILEVLGISAALAVHFGGGSVFGFVAVLALGAGGATLLPFGAVVGIEAALIYLLAIHPPTYMAFRR
jgi:hypothetical protein